MKGEKVDFYAPILMPSGQWIYGSAAANRRMALGGGMNKVAAELVEMGLRLGFAQALKNRKEGRR